MKYIIQSKEGYWNNKIGWVEKDGATIFSEKNLNLPMGENVKWRL